MSSSRPSISPRIFSRSASSVADLARPAVAVENAVARRFQFAHRIDQGDAVHAEAEVVQQLGRLAVVQGAEFLHFPQLDGEDVVESRLVDAGQQRLQDVFALPRAVGGGKDDLLAGSIRGVRVAPRRRESGRWGRPTRSIRRRGRRERAENIAPARTRNRRASSGRIAARSFCRPRSGRRGR